MEPMTYPPPCRYSRARSLLAPSGINHSALIAEISAGSLLTPPTGHRTTHLDGPVREQLPERALIISDSQSRIYHIKSRRTTC